MSEEELTEEVIDAEETDVPAPPLLNVDAVFDFAQKRVDQFHAAGRSEEAIQKTHADWLLDLKEMSNQAVSDAIHARTAEVLNTLDGQPKPIGPAARRRTIAGKIEQGDFNA